MGGLFSDLIPDGPIAEANPHRVGACSECGSYRTDGRPPYLHKPGCSHEGDPQMDRWLAEQATSDHGGPVLYCTEHDHTVREARKPWGMILTAAEADAVREQFGELPPYWVVTDAPAPRGWRPEAITVPRAPCWQCITAGRQP